MYIDTSYIIKTYIEEDGSDEVINLLEGQTELMSSSVASVEFNSTMARKRNQGDINESTYNSACERFLNDVSEGIWSLIDLDRRMVEKSNVVLSSITDTKMIRALDAVHLSTASILGCIEIYSNDAHLLALAPRWGLRGINVIKLGN